MNKVVSYVTSTLLIRDKCNAMTKAHQSQFFLGNLFLNSNIDHANVRTVLVDFPILTTVAMKQFVLHVTSKQVIFGGIYQEHNSFKLTYPLHSVISIRYVYPAATD